MDETSTEDGAVELLQQLGCKEYEARAFVALTRLPRATAKEISEISDVPRTRVYDAIRVLEEKGLVEIQHSNPQQFRAVSIDEAADTLRREYEDRTDTLRARLRDIEPISGVDDTEVTHEVWTLSGTAAITSRTLQLVDEAQQELMLVVGETSAFDEELRTRLRAAQERGVSVLIGTTDEATRDRVRTELPDAEVFLSGLEWLSGASRTDDDTEIGRLLLVDRSTILVSSFHATSAVDRHHEQAVFGRGFDNGLVAIVRRLMATGLLPVDDPGTDAS